jgi:uncharacterized protein
MAADVSLRVYAVADIHGRADRLARLEATAALLGPDVIVVAGDICSRLHPLPVVARLAGLAAPVLAVRGNNDPLVVEALLGHYPRTSSLHRRQKVVGGVRFVGLSGTVPVPFGSLVCWREAEAIASIERFVGPDSVLVVHPPPRGTLDRVLGGLHAGSGGVAGLCLRRRPAVLICGHIHSQAGVATLGETLVVNCAMGRRGNGALITLTSGEPPHAEMIERAG